MRARRGRPGCEGNSASIIYVEHHCSCVRARDCDRGITPPGLTTSAAAAMGNSASIIYEEMMRQLKRRKRESAFKLPTSALINDLVRPGPPPMCVWWLVCVVGWLAVCG